MIARNGVGAELAEWRERAKAAEDLLHHIEERLTRTADLPIDQQAHAAREVVGTIQALRKVAA